MRAERRRCAWAPERLFEPVDARGCAAFRMLFGLAMALGVARFVAKGWVSELVVEPTFHFHYWGFAWVQPLPALGMYLLFGVLFVAALLIAVGRLYRISCCTFLVGFTYVELLDVTNYLNHYYLVSLIAGLLLFMPLGGMSAWGRRTTVPTWVPWTLRAQLVLVYAFAGLAKLDADWLLAAQPLKLWLEARGDLWLVGPLLRWDVTAHVMAVGGAVFDLSVGAFLLHRPTRAWAYAGVVVFHLLTGALFNIGVFPLVMIVMTTVFFDHDWPARWRPARLSTEADTKTEAEPVVVRRRVVVGLLLFFAIQVLLPLRCFLYPGNPLWHEQGFRFAWRVMLMEKTGSVEFEVTEPRTGRRWVVQPRDELTPQQAKMMASSPELILRFAQHIEREVGRDVEVRARSWVSLNGRRSRPLIDARVDLTTQLDGLGRFDWVTDGP